MTDPAALSSQPYESDREHWLALLDLLKIDALVRDFLGRLNQVEEYREGKVSADVLEASAVKSFEGLISRM